MKVKHPKCVYCDERRGRLPKEMPLFCSLGCAYNELIESHMDWHRCEDCGQWRCADYTCRNDKCPSNREPEPEDET